VRRELEDPAFERLRRAVTWPDFSGTRYEIVREIARGGMGVVYEGRDRELQRSVALKLLAPSEHDWEAAERLRREARIMAGLEHPGIVPLHDVGTLPDGRVFYAMKLVTGSRLDELVRESRPLGELLSVFVRITEAVAFAHAHGVIHRDLKPENVLIGSFGEVLVMDWGVAKEFRDTEAPEGAQGELHPGLTAHGTILGTPEYMAPEQARGEAIDARADVYALGAILYFLLTGAPPSREGPRIVPPGTLKPGISPLLEAVCMKALSQSPSARYPSAQDVALEVARFVEGGAVLAYKEGPLAKMRRLVERNKTPILVIVAYILMRLLLLVFGRV
jgi:serine/threonine protein kinase